MTGLSAVVSMFVFVFGFVFGFVSSLLALFVVYIDAGIVAGMTVPSRRSQRPPVKPGGQAHRHQRSYGCGACNRLPSMPFVGGSQSFNSTPPFMHPRK